MQNNLAAQAQVDASKAQVETAKAQIQAAEAAVEAAKAAVEAASVNLGFTHLTSPIAGIAGKGAGADREPCEPGRSADHHGLNG